MDFRVRGAAADPFYCVRVGMLRSLFPIADSARLVAALRATWGELSEPRGRERDRSSRRTLIGGRDPRGSDLWIMRRGTGISRVWCPTWCMTPGEERRYSR